jgi:hypothetical protein
MIERSEDDGFTLKPGEALPIGQEEIREHFERNIALQLRVPGSIHLAHAAGTNVRGHFVNAHLAPDQRSASVLHHHMRDRLHRRRAQELVHAPCVGKEGLDFTAKIVVAPACRREEPVPLRCVAFERGMT